MAYPDIDPDLEACIVMTEDGIKFYGNTATFRTLARWMSWLADSPESEHFSMPILWHLTSHWESKRRVFVATDDAVGEVFGGSQSEIFDNFELTFMMVENSDIDDLREFEESGRLPKGWGKPPE